MSDQDLVALLAQRAFEINVWILVQNFGRFALLLCAVWLCSRAISEDTNEYLILAAFICASFFFFEGSFHYYIHMNGKSASMIEEGLSFPRIGHEHQRAADDRLPSRLAAVGFSAAFVILFFVCRAGIKADGERMRIPNAEYWTKRLALGFVTAIGYYGLMLYLSS